MRILVVLAAVSAAAAQAPHVGDINFYGLHRVPAERILNTLKLKPGDPLPPSKGEMEDRIGKIPGVVLAQVEAVCCEGADAVLFIGVEEKGAPHAAFGSEPSGSAELPQELTDSYHEFLGAVERAAREGRVDEDLTAGHSMMANPEARALQARFLAFAAENLALLRDVVRNAADPEQRAVAAAVIGYAPKKPEVVNDLQAALQDPEPSVRANAMRSLSAFAVLAAKHPDPGLRIQPTWFIEMLNSIVLSDRVESAKALLLLTDNGERAALDRIRERALPALAEMARWKTLRYALPPFLLLGRVAGLPEDQIHRRWETGQREPVIQKALGSPAKKRGA